MNRIKHYASMMFLALVSVLAVTSCSEDDAIADELQGIWEGEVSQEFYTRRGYEAVYQAVDIEFYKDPQYFASGSGVEYDYDRNGYYYTRTEFDYEVRNRRIYLKYYDGDSYYPQEEWVVIHNYSLYGDQFSGEFHDYYGNYMASFSFYRRSSYYYNSSDYNWRRRYYAAPADSANVGEQTEKTWTLVPTYLKKNK